MKELFNPDEAHFLFVIIKIVLKKKSVPYFILYHIGSIQFDKHEGKKTNL